MSDLQIVTGFAILLSGYGQLRCGLSAVDWRIILELGWFPCLTHLSCLTIMPGYLHFHSYQRTWRLLAMGILVILLAVGFLSMANPSYQYLGVNGIQPHRVTSPLAICVFSCHLKSNPQSSLDNIVNHWPGVFIYDYFWTPVLSAVFLLVAFISRVVKVHKYLSEKASQTQGLLDKGGRHILRVIFDAFFARCDARGLRRSLAYRPILAAFLTLRFFVELWTSLAFEVRITWSYSTGIG